MELTPDRATEQELLPGDARTAADAPVRAEPEAGCGSACRPGPIRPAAQLAQITDRVVGGRPQQWLSVDRQPEPAVAVSPSRLQHQRDGRTSAQSQSLGPG